MTQVASIVGDAAELQYSALGLRRGLTEVIAGGHWPDSVPALPGVKLECPPAGLRPRAATQILVVDDCTLQRENLAAILGEDGLDTAAAAWDLASVLLAVAEAEPRVVLLSMTTRESTALLRAIRRVCPETAVIAVCVAEDDEAAIIECAESGVLGYHLRHQSVEELHAVIADVVEGRSSCAPLISSVLMRHLSSMASRPSRGREPDLTAREAEILRMLEVGMTNRDIADQLCIALHTVKNHVHSVLNKLAVRSRAEAAAYSRTRRHGPRYVGTRQDSEPKIAPSVHIP